MKLLTDTTTQATVLIRALRVISSMFPSIVLSSAAIMALSNVGPFVALS